MNHQPLYYFLQKNKNLTINKDGIDSYGKLYLHADGYTIFFKTSDSTDLSNSTITCSSDQAGIEQLFIALMAIRQCTIGADRQKNSYVYVVKYIQYCDSNHILSTNWDAVNISLIYPQPLHSMLQYATLRNIDCGENIILTCRQSSSTNPDTHFNWFKPIMHFTSKTNSIITYEELRKIINRMDTIITGLGYRPIDYQEIEVRCKTEESILENSLHANYLVIPVIPKYGAKDFGPYQDLSAKRIILRNILENFLVKDLTSLHYWRTCCIIASKDDLFLENTLNQQFICLDSLLAKMITDTSRISRKLDEVKDLRKIISDLSTTEQHITAHICKYIASKNFEIGYINNGSLSNKMQKLFYPNQKRNDIPKQERNFLEAANKIRNDLAHGRLFKWPAVLKKEDYSQFMEWLYSNIHKAILDFINRGGANIKGNKE